MLLENLEARQLLSASKDTRPTMSQQSDLRVDGTSPGNGGGKEGVRAVGEGGELCEAGEEKSSQQEVQGTELDTGSGDSEDVAWDRSPLVKELFVDGWEHSQEDGWLQRNSSTDLETTAGVDATIARRAKLQLLRLLSLMPDALAMMGDALALSTMLEEANGTGDALSELAEGTMLLSAAGGDDGRGVGESNSTTKESIVVLPTVGVASKDGLVSPVARERMRQDRAQRDRKRRQARIDGARALYAEAISR